MVSAYVYFAKNYLVYIYVYISEKYYNYILIKTTSKTSMKPQVNLLNSQWMLCRSTAVHAATACEGDGEEMLGNVCWVRHLFSANYNFHFNNFQVGFSKI